MPRRTDRTPDLVVAMRNIADFYRHRDEADAALLEEIRGRYQLPAGPLTEAMLDRMSDADKAAAGQALAHRPLAADLSEVFGRLAPLEGFTPPRRTRRPRRRG